MKCFSVIRETDLTYGAWPSDTSAVVLKLSHSLSASEQLLEVDHAIANAHAYHAPDIIWYLIFRFSH
jgi:hypothetical protein